MKKSFSIIALGALVMLAGCSRSETVPGPATFRLSARLESAGTRATVNGNTGEFAWETGDQIAIHLSSGYQSVTLTADGTTPLYGTAELTVSDGTVTRNGYALFPAAIKDATADGVGSNPLKVTLPATYTGVSATTSASTPLPMVAVNDPDSDLLYFHHVGGLVRIEGLSLPAGTSSVKVAFNKGVTGSFVVNAPAAAEPTITAATASATNSSVTFILGTTMPIVLNVPVPCGEYAWVKVYLDDATDPFDSFDGFTLGRAQGVKLSASQP